MTDVQAITLRLDPETDDWVTVTVPGPYRDMGQVRQANSAAGRHYFSANTMRYFSSRPGIHTYAGRFFVDSVRLPHGSRVYRICAVQDDGAVERIPIEYITRARAIGALRRALRAAGYTPRF